MALTEQQEQRFIEEWDELRSSDYQGDFEKATYFRRLRNRLPAGASGTLQFKAWVGKNLKGISGSNALDYIKLLRSFRTERVWSQLGGFRSLRHLMNLPTAAARARVKTAALARADRDGQPLTYGIVRNIALNMGYRSTVSGRPTQTEMEEKRDLLAQFIFDHHDDIPQRIVDAMPNRLAIQFA